MEKPKKVFAVLSIAFPKMSFETHCPNQGKACGKERLSLAEKRGSLEGVRERGFNFVKGSWESLGQLDARTMISPETCVISVFQKVFIG